MDLQIESLEDLILFVKREDVSVDDAIIVFATVLEVVPIIFKDKSGKQAISKSKTIEIIQKYVNNYKDGIVKKVVTFSKK
jgi:hypothetical protein